MRSLKEWLEYGTGFLESRMIQDAETDAWLLLEYTANITRSFYYMNMHDPMDPGDAEDYLLLLQRRAEHIPVQYLIGEAWFYGHSFRVNRDVLIPRMDTEILVEEAVKRLEPGMRVLDLCTGSGCILLSILKESSVTGVGTDISKDALLVAEMNRKRLSVSATWIESDLFAMVGGTFHMIVSNPPYIRTDVIDTLDREVKDFEPYAALNGGADGLDYYRRITAEAGTYLEPDGWLCMEIGYDQGKSVPDLMRSAGFADVSTVKDLSGLDRVVLGRKA